MKLDARKMYPAWVALIGTIGIVMALSNPIAGFAITAGVTIISLAVVMTDLKMIDERLPSLGDRTLQEHMPSIRIAVLTLATFIPFLFPEAVIAIGVVFLFVAGLTYLELASDIQFGINGTIDNVAVLILIGGAIVFSGIVQPLLLIAPAAMFYWYVFTLLPFKTQRKLVQRLN